MLKFKRERAKAPASPTARMTFAGGTRDIKDLIAPDGFEVTPSYVAVGSGRFVRSYFVAHVPSKVLIGWLEGLQSMGDVDISYHVIPANDRDVIEELTNKITMLDAQIILDDKQGDYRNISINQQQALELLQLRDEIHANRNRVLYVSILFTIAAESLQQLERKSKLIEEIMGGRAVHVRQAFLRQPEALRSVAPMADNQITRVYRNFDLGSGTTLFPFIGGDLAHERGVLLGVNIKTGAPVFYDSFAGPPVLTNPHMALIATSGAGKTTLVKLLSLRSALGGIRTVFVDPEGEYGALVKGAGGIYVRLQPGSAGYINPFEISTDEDEEGRPFVNIRDKVADLKGLVAVMVEGSGDRIRPEEAALVEDTLFEEYHARGIDEDPANLYYETSGLRDGVYVARTEKKQMPTLSSFYARLQSKGAAAERLLTLLKPYLSSGSMGLFDGESKVDLKSARLVAFDVSRLEERFLRPFAMYVALGWIWEEFVKADRRTRKRVVVDEAWTMMKYQETANFLETMARRARKYGTSLCVATQNFMEFAASQQGTAVITNLDTLILMQQNSKEIDTISQVFKLSEGQREFLSTAQVGQALIRAGKDIAAFTAEVADFEWPLLKGVV